MVSKLGLMELMSVCSLHVSMKSYMRKSVKKSYMYIKPESSKFKLLKKLIVLDCILTLFYVFQRISFFGIFTKPYSLITF